MDMYSARPSPALAWPGQARPGLAHRPGPAGVCVCGGGSPPSIFQFFQLIEEIELIRLVEAIGPIEQIQCIGYL